MPTVTPPKAPIPIGTVTIAGKRYDVDQWPEFTRFFYDLWVRTGRVSAATNAELEELVTQLRAKADVVFVGDAEQGEQGWPGAPGAPGPAGAQGVGMLGEQGEQGEPGWPCAALPAYRVPFNATSVRALNTTYTNVSTSILSVHLTMRCAVTLAGGNAYAQAKMDTAAPPTVIATGLVGIQAGLLGEDNSFQMVFWVNPGGTYRVDSSATNGTVTLGNWFELPI